MKLKGKHKKNNYYETYYIKLVIATLVVMFGLVIAAILTTQ